MNRSKLHARTLLALTMFVLLSPLVHAQEARSTLSGTITDQSGSAVAGARVRITNTETGITMSTVSTEVGQYRLLFVNPGTYRLTVEMSGFRTFVREGILLTLGEAATLDVPMEGEVLW